MGSKEGLKSAIESIQPQQSAKDGNWYYTRDELIAIVDEVKIAGYWGQVDLDNPAGVKLHNDYGNGFFAAFSGSKYMFNYDVDMGDVAKLYNEITDDRASLRYPSGKRGGMTEAFDKEFENVMQNAEGYYDINFIRSVQKEAQEELRSGNVAAFMRTAVANASNPNPPLGQDGEIAGVNDAVGKILNAYKNTYEGIRDESAIHHIFCCYDKDSRDKNGEWSWKKDDLGQNSPLYEFYLTLEGDEKRYFEEGISKIKELSDVNKYAQVGAVINTQDTIDQLIDTEKQRLQRAEGRAQARRDASPEVSSEPVAAVIEEAAREASGSRASEGNNATTVEREKSSTAVRSSDNGAQQTTVSAEPKLTYVKTQAGEELQVKLAATLPKKADGSPAIVIDGGKIGPETSLACIKCGLGADLAEMFNRPIEEINSRAAANDHEYFIMLNNKQGYRENVDNQGQIMMAALDIDTSQYNNLAYNGLMMKEAESVRNAG